LSSEQTRGFISSRDSFHWARKLVFPNSYLRVGSRVSHLEIRLPTSMERYFLRGNS